MTRFASIERQGPAAARAALAECLQAHGVAVFPADGLYGLCCDPLDAGAVGRIHALKGRDDGKPSAVMYFSAPPLRELISGMGPRTRAAAGALLPGPVTLVIANPEGRYPLACRGEGAPLGVRLIEGPLAGLMWPVFQTSANLSGEAPPATFEGVPTEIVDAADLAIDGGELAGEPSTVLDLTRLDEDGAWSILREGGLPAERIAEALGGDSI